MGVEIDEDKVEEENVVVKSILSHPSIDSIPLQAECGDLNANSDDETSEKDQLRNSRTLVIEKLEMKISLLENGELDKDTTNDTVDNKDVIKESDRKAKEEEEKKKRDEEHKLFMKTILNPNKSQEIKSKDDAAKKQSDAKIAAEKKASEEAERKKIAAEKKAKEEEERKRKEESARKEKEEEERKRKEQEEAK